MIGRDCSRISHQMILKFNQSHTITVPFKFDSSMHHRMSPTPTCRMSQETRDTLHLVDSILDEILSRDNIIEIVAIVEASGLTIQGGHVVGGDVSDRCIPSVFGS
jgi:hypothetical protein